MRGRVAARQSGRRVVEGWRLGGFLARCCAVKCWRGRARLLQPVLGDPPPPLPHRLSLGVVLDDTSAVECAVPTRLTLDEAGEGRGGGGGGRGGGAGADGSLGGG
eukprot:15160928-Alexandrium_andersonii.AAC.1